ncbi:LuxR C-terminal-related transcriptional regulator [Streptomyces sasae]|uniref:LuxR C-terminal-related transcriptional regulator n=1 Tax=Streptomyces sasae TaxID=1266772 RepID=UPI00292DA0E8|nr:LuxR C-terminal-related transcriptional regulator [Streptomyces sasae]
MHAEDGNRLLAEALGVDEICIRVYRALLARPSGGVGEIVRTLNASEREVRGALDDLAKISMLDLADNDLAVPINPEVVLAGPFRLRELDIYTQQVRLAATRAAAADLAASYASLQSDQQSARLEVLSGIPQIRARLTELADRAEQEVLSFSPGGAQSRESLDASRPLDERSLGKGVQLKTIYLDSVRNDRATVEYTRWLSKLGGEVRTVPTLPVRMLIVDRSVAILPTNPANSREGAVLVSSSGAVTALVALFEQIWEQAVPLGVQRPNTPEGPTAQEQELLKLLAGGHTDEVAARQLGVSLRTVRRIMAELMNRLGARSRFEAGLLAARSGWL